jgi:vitamin B12 transporter
MKKIILVSLLMAQFFTRNVFADPELKTSDVFVTATRTPIPENNVISDTTTITEEEIERAGSSSLVDLLQKQPGIEISNYGGAGKLSTISLRGTSSNHTVILLDGFRIDSAFSGLTALQNLSLSQIEKIEIVRGASSGLYGADAIGGVIQIFTKKGVSGFNPYVGVGAGSYNTKSIQTGVRSANEDTSYAINLSGFNTGGFSAFKPNNLANSNSFNLDNDGYSNLSLSSSINHKLNESDKIAFNIFLSRGRNQFDNSSADQYIYNGSPGYSDFRDTQLQESFNATYTGQFTKNLESIFKIGRSIDQYVALQKSPDYYNIYKTNDMFRSTQDSFSWQNNFNASFGFLTFLYEHANQKIDATDQPVYDAFLNTYYLAPYAKKNRANDGFMIGYLANRDSHNLQINLRRDLNSLYQDSTTGNLGYAYNINSQWKIATSYGTAFRSPTFNDAYYPDRSQANPNLQPEKSRNIEATIKYQNDLDYLSLTTFKNKIHDFIALDSNYLPGNLDKVEITGATVSGSHFFNHLQVKANYTYQEPKNNDTNKLLSLKAKVYGNISADYYIDNWNIGTEITGSGSRFNDETNINKIKGYVLTNIVADYKINQTLKLNLRLENIFDKDYSLVLDTLDSSHIPIAYATPGRSFFVNIRYEPQ